MLAVVVSAAYAYRGQPYGGTWLGRVLAGLAGVYGWFSSSRRSSSLHRWSARR